MKKTTPFNFISLVFCSLLIISCSDTTDMSVGTAASINRNEYIKYGKKLENPYSIKNMRKALFNLKEKTKGKSSTSK
jgi:hypothetical protein